MNAYSGFPFFILFYRMTCSAPSSYTEAATSYRLQVGWQQGGVPIDRSMARERWGISKRMLCKPSSICLLGDAESRELTACRRQGQLLSDVLSHSQPTGNQLALPAQLSFWLPYIGNRNCCRTRTG
ncbi:hypothetical protein B0T25DRAFT_535103 [Lasiosphaeria hispida]|uniref:Uncharacterized protein n=1 Tax=Lasiosphaeria hispida TaxID=260671 RepID=A0AAJ0HRP2_9PEZI|nr:hypothetical protein B0T25DRAFT_535103 [Lasiosphaeria hispida]